MTGKKRLRVLANYLLSGAVDDDEFNMKRWPTCAVGEGTRLPSLAKEGLELGWDCDSKEIPMYEGEKGTSACAKFFDLSYDLAWKFFGPSSKRAAAVGRQLLKYLNG